MKNKPNKQPTFVRDNKDKPNATKKQANYASAWKCPLHQCKNCGFVMKVDEKK